MKRLFSISLVLITGIALLGCRTSKSGGSEVKWGLSPDHQNYLIYYPDGATIRVCGAHFEEIKWAIATWAKAIDREYNIVQSCGDQHISSFGPDDPFAIEDCKRWNMQGRRYSQATLTPMRLVDCKSTKDVKLSMLHEAGHLFGLCDQYEGQRERCSVSTDPVPGSVMHSAQSLYLTEDDIMGLKALEARARNPR
jgi:hypothetical protein